MSERNIDTLIIALVALVTMWSTLGLIFVVESYYKKLYSGVKKKVKKIKKVETDEKRIQSL